MSIFLKKAKNMNTNRQKVDKIYNILLFLLQKTSPKAIVLRKYGIFLSESTSSSSKNFNSIYKSLEFWNYDSYKYRTIFFCSTCKRVPAMRCKIEKRTVVKTKPESKCSRVPRQFCRKEDCNKIEEEENLFSDDPNCYYRNQIVSTS